LGFGPGRFTNPSGITTDSLNNVYIADFGENNNVQKFDSTGSFIKVGKYGNPYSTQKSYKKFDLFGDQILKQYHTLVEIKNLRDQLSTRQQQQQAMPTVYLGISSGISNIVESTTVATVIIYLTFSI
jgi:hypothetical protein